MKKQWSQWWRGWVVLALGLFSVGAVPPPPSGNAAAALLADALPAPWTMRTVAVQGDVVTVCLHGPTETLAAGDGIAAELLESAVAQALTPLEWRVLHVQSWDAATETCRGLSDFLPRKAQPALPESAKRAPAPARAGFGALSGKTIYVSAGHGWQWTGSQWRTQRPVYQGFIEDHNNAEVVNQFLIPYLEQAGATVIPVRERDRNAVRVVGGPGAGAPIYQEQGSWSGGTGGYAGGGYRYATTVTGEATARATWQLQVSAAGQYALYAWVVPGADRAPDARYQIGHAGGTVEVRLDQSRGPATWHYLGTFPFYAGPVTVTLDNRSAVAGRALIADALRLGGGDFDSLVGINTTGPTIPNRPWWESATYYYSQWMGLNINDWPYFNDVVARPMFARWNYRAEGGDALYLSWHTNGYNGTVRGTESYVHDGTTYPRTAGSLELQAAVHDELIHDLRAGWDPGWVDRGKKQRDLGEVRMLWDSEAAARMPGVLVEIAYHDHPDDAAALKDPRFEQLAARAIYQGIVHYFEQRDGVDLTLLPEPPTGLRVENLGSGAVRVAWEPPAGDSSGLGGEAATGYNVYASSDGFAWEAAAPVSGTEARVTGLAAGTTRYFRVTATNAGGESFPTEVLGARVGDRPGLLLVTGYDKLNAAQLVAQSDPVEGTNARMWLEQMNRRDYGVAHGAAAAGTGIAWDSASNEAVTAGRIALTRYGMVDWILGEESNVDDGTLTASERAALAAFLDEGRALLISGAELAWDLEAIGRDPAFLHDRLHTDYLTDDAETKAVAATGTGPFAGLGAFTFDAPGEYDVDYPDGIGPWPGSGAQTVLTYTTGSGAGVAYAGPGGCPRTLVLGFPLEIVRPESRGGVMARALDYLSPCAALEPETGIAAPAAGGIYSITPAASGWAWGPELVRVEAQLQEGAGGNFWDGAGWAVSPTWLTATGTVSWSYPLPVLSDGRYTLTVRALGALTDSTPAAAGFTLDTLPPAAPEPITPTGGISLTALQTRLMWAAPADSGTPLHYQAAVDGVTGAWISATEVTLSPAPGIHRWQVRAMDAAGNVGLWSAESDFVLEQPRVYLPLVLRAFSGTGAICTAELSDGFEDGAVWSFSGPALQTAEIIHGGSRAARVGVLPGQGAPAGTLYASASRVLELPAGARQITLRYWRSAAAGSDDPDDRHYLSLKDAAGQTLKLVLLPLATVPGSTGWEETALDLSPWAGSSIRLYLGVINDAGEPTGALYLDDVTLEVCR